MSAKNLVLFILLFDTYNFVSVNPDHAADLRWTYDLFCDPRFDRPDVNVEHVGDLLFCEYRIELCVVLLLPYVLRVFNRYIRALLPEFF
jgi:hypothetical protein